MAAEQPHFEKTSFRLQGKIFASLDVEKLSGCLKLSMDDQQAYCSMDKAIYPVNNNWGKSGWTNIDLQKVPEALLAEAMDAAYKEVSTQTKPTKRKQ